MKEITKTYKVYEFSELSDSVKEKVLNEFRYMETEHDWYWSCYEDFEQQLEEIGIKVKSDTKYQGAFYFSLDRDNFFAIRDGSIVDVDKFWKFCGWDINDKEDNEYKEAQENGLSLKVQHYSGGVMRNYVELGWSEHEDMTKKLQELLSTFLDTLKKEYEYLTSDEVVKEVIETNEYLFTEDGKTFNE